MTSPSSPCRSWTASVRHRNRKRPGVTTDCELLPRRMAYLGCAGALGYGGMKVIWALGGTIGMTNPERFHSIENGLEAPQRFFDYWGTPILAGLAVVILLGLVHRWGRAVILRPLLRALAWVGSVVGVAGVAGLILTMSGTSLVTSGANDHNSLDTGTYLFTYVCFLAVGLGFGVTAWLTRGSTGRHPRHVNGTSGMSVVKEEVPK